MENVERNLDYNFLLTIYEVIDEITRYCEKALDDEDPIKLGVHLQLASRAMRCALEIYGSHLGEVLKRGNDE